MKITEKLGLKKPEPSDTFDIQDLNDNADILDELWKNVYQVGTVLTTTDESFNPMNEFGGTWILKNNDYKRIYIGSQLLDPGTSNTSSLVSSWVSTATAYSYALLSNIFLNIDIPSGYHKEYKLTFLGSTGNTNKIILALNNIETNECGTWSSATYRMIGSTPFFKESDIVLETASGYSTNGINLKYKTTAIAARWQWWDATIHGYLVSDKKYYEWERTA